MIFGRLPIRVLCKMRTVCRHWNYLLSSRVAFERLAPIWSLRSTPGFLIQIHWNPKDDVDSWVIEERGSDMYKVPLLNHAIVNSCKSIFCCHRKGDMLDLFIGIPGTRRNWVHLPPPPIPAFTFNGLAFDSSTRRCTLLLGRYSFSHRRIVMCIYDSQSNAWTQVSMMVPDHIRPTGKGIYCNGKFYWVSLPPNPLNPIPNLMVAFNIADGLWTEIPLPQRCRRLSPENLGEYNGQVVLLERKGHDCVLIWKLNEAEVWCVNRLTKCSIPLFNSVAVNSSGLILVMDQKMNISIYDWEGKSIVWRMRLPVPRMSQRPIRVSISSFESDNLWWP